MAEIAEAVAASLIGDDHALNIASSPVRFIPPTLQQLQQGFLVGIKLLKRLAFDAGTTAATSHLVWLISITAMIVLSCSRVVRDLLGSKRKFCDMGHSVSGR